MIAYSIYQFHKWKSFQRGETPFKDMNILIQTYRKDIVSTLGQKFVDEHETREVLMEFVKHLHGPSPKL